jgi:GTPase
MNPLLAIVGRPNVGKSTLFNRLVGYTKAIVDDQPGVTRDRNYGETEVGGRRVTVIDTGGFDTDERTDMMTQVREQTLLAIEEADLTVLLTDGKQGLAPHDRELIRILRRSERPFLVAVNKIDGPEKDGLLGDFYELGVDPILPLSAAHGYGIHNFQDIAARMLPPIEEAVAPLEEMIRVAVIGRPNVGKSSLINQLIGDRRAVVSDMPGTTRDPLDMVTTHDGRRYLFVDTAGIRRKGRVSVKVEKFAIVRALRSLERAEVAILVIDSLEGITDQDAHVAGYAVERGRALIMLFNKWDLVKNKHDMQKQIKLELERKMKFVSFAPILTASALTGLRVERIYPYIDRVHHQLVLRAPTSMVNQVLEKAVLEHTPPYVGRRRLKFYYATQTGVKPPTFIVFANKPEKVHFSYHRYLTNCFRKAFHLDLVPVRVFIRPKNKEKP